MLIHKGFRYRIYPTAEQEARLLAWEAALRFLWNLANEQRRMGYARPRSERRYPTAFDQINQLTELRAELPWLADVPYNVCAQLLVELDRAWQRCFKRLANHPQWKRKYRDVLGLTEPHVGVWRLKGIDLRFPKLGPIRAVLHRPLEGKPKTCTIRRDGAQWFTSITCEIELPDPPRRTEPVVAIDRGITNLTADSNGRLTPNPKHLERALARLARAQRIVSRRKKGSHNRKKAVARVARIHQKVRRQREHLLHGLSHDYAKSHGTVVVEKLNVQGMGKNRHLARHIAGAAWGRLVEMLWYKLAWSGGQLVEVPAAYSSQTCARCGHVDKSSRVEQSVFHCTSCSATAHADLNAAQVLLQRFRAVEPTVTGCGGSATGRPAKQQLRVVRRGTRKQGLGSPLLDKA